MSKNRCVVRLLTNVWRDERCLHIKRTLRVLRRHGRGYNLLQEDLSNLGPTEVYERIVNLNSCPDGLYEVVICNETMDWESGHVDDYDYKLVAFDPAKDADAINCTRGTDRDAGGEPHLPLE